jgi:dolichol-phosphate mannosyltransferase
VTATTPPDTTVLVPTFNEGGNVEVLVRRLAAALEHPERAEVLFVDDSTDDTPARVREVARQHHMPVRLLHRAPEEP